MIVTAGRKMPRIGASVGVVWITTMAQAGVQPSYEAVRLGLIGPGYRATTSGIDLGLGGETYAVGTELAYPADLNAHGWAVGRSTTYNDTGLTGAVAWLDDGNGPRPLGFAGPEYLNDAGVPRSSAAAINDAGLVVGSSTRFEGSTELGSTAWRDDGSGPEPLGFFGADPLGRDYLGGAAVDVNNAGQAIGMTGVSLADNSEGRVAWIDDGNGATRIGLAGPGYVRQGNDQEFAFVYDLNDRGQAVGMSLRYAGAETNGRAVWVDDGSGPVRLGFTGGEYRRSTDGRESSEVVAINNLGQAIGYSQSYRGQFQHGFTGWIDDGSGPVAVGLTGPGYVQQSDGRSASFPTAINDAGQVIGTSERYDALFAGTSAWFFDPATGQTAELVFSTNIQNFARTDPQLLAPDGTVYGIYFDYDTPGLTDRRKPFVWTLDGGFIDIAARVRNPDADGWGLITGFIGIADDGRLLVEVTDPDSPEFEQAAFVLVPEPGAAALGLLLLAALRPRKG